MLLSDFNLTTEKLMDLCLSIADAKRPAYTSGSADVLHNFKAVAARVGITPMQVWAVYFLKHVDAIVTAARSPDTPQAESLDGRFADAINYLQLGHALIGDR